MGDIIMGASFFRGMGDFPHARNSEFAYSELDEATWRMCLRMFSRYLPTPPASILDVGCGTGRDLDILSRICPDCWGIDCLPEMIESSRAQRPHLHLRVGDMRSVRLGRTFDVITCMGSGFMYARYGAKRHRPIWSEAVRGFHHVIIGISRARCVKIFPLEGYISIYRVALGMTDVRAGG